MGFLLLVHSFAQESDPAEAPPKEILFAAYNVHNYLTMERRVAGEVVVTTKPDHEKAALVNLLAKVKPQILGLCEIGGEEDLEDFRKRLREAGMEYSHHTMAKSFDSTRRLALLSQFPIVATNHQTQLTYQLEGEQRPFQRGILDATIQANEGYSLRLLGAHLKSKRVTEEGDQALMRQHEALLLRGHIEKILAESLETNLLVYGDFNETRNEPPIKIIQGAFGSEGYMKDVQAADENGQVWTYFWDFADQYSRFDYVFLNKGLAKEVAMRDCYIATAPDWAQASDHRPVVVKILAEEK